MDTTIFLELDLKTRLQTFRIMAPEATQRTAFKKDCCPDAWAIMDRKTLDIKNYTCKRHGKKN
jgi:hypothetical protein